MAYMKDKSGRRLDALEVASRLDVPQVAAFQSTYSALDRLHPVLDVNYVEKMALYGFETHTRASTDTYTDALGVTQTAAVDAPAFDRLSRLGVLTPVGLKLSPGATLTFNVNALIPAVADYTIIVDVDRASGYVNSGNFFAIDDGAGGTANRIVMSLNSNYQGSFTVQASGAVVVNQSMGAIQSWGAGGHRRFVLTVKTGAYYFSDTGLTHGASTSAGTPSRASLLQLRLGSAGFAGWIKRVQIIPKAMTRTQAVTLAAAPIPLSCWGDSLTEQGYPNTLRNLRHPRSGVFNGGVGGETSTQVKTRMVADDYRTDWTSVIWVGRNNYAQTQTVLDDIAAMVAKLTHRRFVVMSVINKAVGGGEDSGSAAYTQIMALNAAIAAKYPDNYVDIRSLLVAASGGANDAIAQSWSSDGLHLTASAYDYVADQVSQFLRAKTWF